MAMSGVRESRKEASIDGNTLLNLSGPPAASLARKSLSNTSRGGVHKGLKIALTLQLVFYGE
jgi:hypothetical protein